MIQIVEMLIEEKSLRIPIAEQHQLKDDAQCPSESRRRAIIEQCEYACSYEYFHPIEKQCVGIGHGGAHNKEDDPRDDDVKQSQHLCEDQ